MGLAVLYSRALSGMEAALVTVEVHLANGLPNFTIVGLPETEVKESKDRVRAAGNGRAFILPQDNAAEAALVENAKIYAHNHCCRWRHTLPDANRLHLMPTGRKVPRHTIQTCAKSRDKLKPSVHWKSPPRAGIAF
jgi:predicted ATPase with chaperone activity